MMIFGVNIIAMLVRIGHLHGRKKREYAAKKTA